MLSKRTSQRVRLSGLTRCSVTVACAVALATGASVTGVERSAPASAATATTTSAKPVPAAGVGTAAAKNAPYCDPKDGQLAIPYQKRPPCVRPMKAG